MPGVQVRCLADVEPEEVLWHWTGRIPRGKLVEMFGLPGVGKSTVITGIVAALTTGNALPGDESGVDPINVLLLSAEDGVADTIRPRLDKAEDRRPMEGSRGTLRTSFLRGSGLRLRGLAPASLINDYC